MNCVDIISKEINASCIGNERLEREAVIINKKDVVVARDSGGLLTISIASGKSGYKVTQPANAPFTGSNKAVVVGTYGNTIDKAITLVVPIDYMSFEGISGQQSGAMRGLLNGEFVVITKLKDNVSDGTLPHRYEVIGLENGATISEGAQEFYNEDTRGNWLVTLTETGATEPHIYANARVDGTTVEDFNTAIDTWFASLTA
jgi:hypothetical protein